MGARCLPVWAMVAFVILVLPDTASFSVSPPPLRAMDSKWVARAAGIQVQEGARKAPPLGGGGRLRASLIPGKGRKYQAPIVFPSDGEHSATLIFLHGWNSQGSGRGLELAKTLNLPWFKVVAPQAPMYRLADGFEVQSWVDVSSGTLAMSALLSLPLQGIAAFDSVRRMAQGAPVSPDSLISDIGLAGPYRRLQGDSTDRRCNVGHFRDLIEAEMELGIDPQRIIFAGYSQGGCTALSACASMEYQLGGCISLCSWFPQSLSEQEKHSLKGMPALVCHGTADTYVPFELGTRAHEDCTELGMQASFREYAGLGHEISEDVTRDMRRFLQEHCPRQTPPNGQRVL